MIRGRRPTPTHLKLVKGDSRKEGIVKLEQKAAREARFPAQPPTPPVELSEDAKIEWLRLCPILSSIGIVTEIDRGALAAVCTSYGRWMQAERLLAKIRAKDPVFEGILIRSAKNNLMANPVIGISNKAMNDYVRLCTEFGMTPASRARIDIAGEGREDADEEFFRD